MCKDVCMNTKIVLSFYSCKQSTTPENISDEWSRFEFWKIQWLTKVNNDASQMFVTNYTYIKVFLIIL